MRMLLVVSLLAAIQSNPASLTETTDWIRTTLANHGNYVEKDGRTTRSKRIESLTFDGCTMTGSYVAESTLDSRTLVSVTQDVNLSLAQIEEVSITNKSGYWVIHLKATAKSIKGELRTRIPGNYTREPLAASAFQMPCDDEQVAIRLKAALQHAVGLCKKQREPF